MKANMLVPAARRAMAIVAALALASSCAPFALADGAGQPAAELAAGYSSEVSGSGSDGADASQSAAEDAAPGDSASAAENGSPSASEAASLAPAPEEGAAKPKKPAAPKKKKGSKYTTVAKVKLDRKSVTIRNDGVAKLKATLVKKAKSKKLKRRDRAVKWSISDKKVASITQDGVLQGKRAGTAIVSAKARNGKVARAKVRVVIDAAKMATAIPVLTYHRIAANSAKPRYAASSSLVISASMFESEMKWLVANGYRTVSTAEFRDWRANGTFLPKKSILVTIDDGFYETYHVAYPILKKYNLKATSFIIGAFTPKTTAKYNPADTANHYLGLDVIERVRKKYPNLEFQSHTYNMHYRAASGAGIATTYSRKAIDEDCEKASKFSFTALAYPFGHLSANFVESLHASKEINIAFGYQMNHAATRTSALYNIPRFKVLGDGSLAEFAAIASTAR